MRKYLLGIAVVLMAVSFAAFRSPVKTKAYETVTFQYSLDQQSGINSAGNWDDVTGVSPDDCGDPGDLPCIVQFSTEDFAPQNNDRGIASFLSTYPNASSIMNSGHLLDSKVDLSK